MTRINPRKLLLSKWTATQPKNREKHFIVSKIISNANGDPAVCELESVYSKRTMRIHWRDLLDSENWQQGWL